MKEYRGFADYFPLTILSSTLQLNNYQYFISNQLNLIRGGEMTFRIGALLSGALLSAHGHHCQVFRKVM